MAKKEAIDITRLSSTRIARLVQIGAIKNKLSTFIWGPPGIGKSDTIRQIGDKLNAPVIDVRLSSFDPTDVRGIAFFNPESRRMEWAQPVSFPDEEFCAKHKHVILFLDEINSAAPSVQAAAYQLILDRRVGEYVLPDNVAIIAAGNRDTDRGVTYKMATPLANRFLHLEMKADFDSWFDWAIENDVHSAVIGFLGEHKPKLMDFDPTSGSRSFPTPRSWTMLSTLLKEDLSEDDIRVLAEGTVGPAATNEFMQHLKFHHQLPKAADVLDGKVTELKVKDISAHYSMLVNLYYELTDRFEKIPVNERTYPNRDAGPKMVEFFKGMDRTIEFMINNFTDEMCILSLIMIAKGRGVDGETEGKFLFDHHYLTNFSVFAKKYSKYITAAAH